ncbi:unnamed protein product [Echinostoma caproni]|uniref:BHLH domain-containing protein n=1 Tax=Echinostoma caproni TaxID=27848 RepID=A0A183B5C3_9TREM|nr:unnamed protein product [Echinostoma caproni]
MIILGQSGFKRVWNIHKNVLQALFQRISRICGISPSSNRLIFVHFFALWRMDLYASSISYDIRTMQIWLGHACVIIISTVLIHSQPISLSGVQNGTLLDPDTYEDKRVRAHMERQLKRLLPSVYQLADARQTRPSARQAIYAQCKQLQRALENLLNEYNRKVICSISVDLMYIISVITINDLSSVHHICQKWRFDLILNLFC